MFKKLEVETSTRAGRPASIVLSVRGEGAPRCRIGLATALAAEAEIADSDEFELLLGSGEHRGKVRLNRVAGGGHHRSRRRARRHAVQLRARSEIRSHARAEEILRRGSDRAWRGRDRAAVLGR